MSHRSINKALVAILIGWIGLFGSAGGLYGHARSVMTPWESGPGVYQLVYGSSSLWDIQQALGRPPDQVVHAGQMYPVLQNAYYFDENGSGAATIFVLENGILAGMHYKSPGNQLVDLTSFLMNNNDRALQAPYLQGYQGYYPAFDMYYGGYGYE